MNQLELIKELAEGAGQSARLVMAWPAPATITTVDDAAVYPYVAIITDALRVLKEDAVDQADEDAISAVARWKMWEKIADETALDYDESQGDRSTSLSQMHEQAMKRANRYYFDALPHIPTYKVKRATIIRRPGRFKRSHMEMG